MDIKIVGRNVRITDRFRDYATEKSQKIDHLTDKVISFEVKVTRQNEKGSNPQSADQVELTLVSPKTVIRAEASGTDKYVAFDSALTKLVERVRRAKDRKKAHRGARGAGSLREASEHGFNTLGISAASVSALEQVRTGENPDETLAETHAKTAAEEVYSPVVIREKVFEADPMSVDDALYHMELVGHDFYLFVDEQTNRPSVVYRRKGWDYGVIAIKHAE